MDVVAFFAGPRSPNPGTQAEGRPPDPAPIVTSARLAELEQILAAALARRRRTERAAQRLAELEAGQ